MNGQQKHVAGQVTAFLWSIAWPLLLGALIGAALCRLLQRRRLAWTWVILGYPATYCLWFVERRIAVICLAASIMATYVGLTIHGEMTQAGGEEARAARERRGLIKLLQTVIRRRHSRSARRLTTEGLAIGSARGGHVCRIPFGLGNGVHGLVAGATGSGKTVTQAQIAEAYVDAGLAAIVIDPKGDEGLRSTLEAAAVRRGATFRTWSPAGPTVYNPVGRGGPTEIVDKALSAHRWSEPHYELATQRLLGHVLATMQAVGEWPPTLSGVVANMDTELLDAKADKVGGPLAVRVSAYVDSRSAKSSADLGGGRDRLAVLVESELGPYLDPSLGDGEVLDLHQSVRDGDVLYFHLDADRYPAASKLLAAALMIDLVGLTSEARHSQLGALVVIDEFAALAAEQVSRLFARARSAGLSLLLGTQSLADLRGARPDDPSDTLTEQVLSNVEFTLAHRIGDPDSAERLARLAGTVPSWTNTHRTSGHLLQVQTGEGTRTRAREFLIGPDEFKRLGTGEAVVIQPRAKHPAEIVSVWPPRRGEGRA
jgi:type IV secretory pathway TraG/TraD family ATPase VirD4